MDHVTWPRSFRGQFVVRRLGLAMINLHAKFEVSKITCNEDMKNVQISRFELPFGGLRDVARTPSMDR